MKGALNLPLRSHLATLGVRCIHSARGCTELSKISNLDAHEKTCSFEAQCEVCEAFMPTARLAQHWATECEERQYACQRLIACAASQLR
jgi:hypothetical protein